MENKAQVAILMGSDSDWPLVVKAVDVLNKFGVCTDVRILSAHRTPGKVREYIQTAEENGVKVFIGAAGKAAHLPGVIASLTTLPVIGIPIKSSATGGLDALLSIVQMPAGIPVATVAIDGAENAALLAIQILSVSDSNLKDKLIEHRKNMGDTIEEKNKRLQEQINGDRGQA